MSNSLPQLAATDFFGAGITKVNDALAQVLNVAQSIRYTDLDSGLAVPVVLVMGSSATHWLLPDGVIGTFLVLDHGFVLRADQYTINTSTQEVVLGYTPSSPYNISVTWSSGRAGVTAPVALTQADTIQRWNLPANYGVNVLVFDHGRILRRDEYRITSGIVQLLYTPAASYDISASWGAGSPGMRAPFALALVGANPRIFQLPVDHGGSVLVFDNGLMLSTDDYTVDLVHHTITLTYNPALPNDVAATWGYPLNGVFVPEMALTPAPNSSVVTFALSVTPATDTILVYIKNADNTITFYKQYTDYVVEGSSIRFINSIVPATGTTVYASMMSTILGAGTTGSAGPGTDSSVSLDYGMRLQQDALTKTVSTNSDGTLAQIQLLDGVTLVGTVTFTYNANGTLATVTETAGGHSFIQTHTYDVNGLWTGVTDSIA